MGRSARIRVSVKRKPAISSNTAGGLSKRLAQVRKRQINKNGNGKVA